MVFHMRYERGRFPCNTATCMVERVQVPYGVSALPNPIERTFKDLPVACPRCGTKYDLRWLATATNEFKIIRKTSTPTFN
jgi:hypothetical protein